MSNPATGAPPGTNSFRTTLGARFLSRIEANQSLLLVPEVRAGWSHEFGDDNGTMQARFAGTGGGSGFSVEGVRYERDMALIGAGVTAHTDGGFSVFAGYDIGVGGDQLLHTLTAGVRYAF